MGRGFFAHQTWLKELSQACPAFILREAVCIIRIRGKKMSQSIANSIDQNDEMSEEEVQLSDSSNIEPTTEATPQVRVPHVRGFRQACPTRWNSTYRDAICQFKFSEENFKFFPNDDKWKEIEKNASFLKVFYDLTNLFSGTSYPTANLYFQGVWKVQVTLLNAALGDDVFLRNVANQMQGKFDKYWSNYSKILAMIVILDPRFKIQFVSFCLREVQPMSWKDRLNDIQHEMHSLFDEHVKHHSPSTSKKMLPLKQLLVMIGFKTFAKEDEEALMYLILSRMARDILSIPTSTVASESTFSIGGKVISMSRSFFTPDNAETIILTRDWLYSREDFVDKEELVEDIAQAERAGRTPSSVSSYSV
ncbi:zinc finger BED domain-containing protein DAYSLEEPER-like [Malania oleifera]|uniref:zinc finger BED domain-containing protein DAYSLEEPER-like n=1 Tax=Malania oleifera TaxID=397392 RepID=UPI0025ADE6F9|nr:zinc finger BED domain-containing protein DAYSLEEPER-like [Malania oleifera]